MNLKKNNKKGHTISQMRRYILLWYLKYMFFVLLKEELPNNNTSENLGSNILDLKYCKQ